MQRKLQSIGHACKAESILQQLSLKLKRNPGQHCDNLSQCSIFVVYVGKCRYAIEKMQDVPHDRFPRHSLFDSFIGSPSL
jgi:hypothetical protein